MFEHYLMEWVVLVPMNEQYGFLTMLGLVVFLPFGA